MKKALLLLSFIFSTLMPLSSLAERSLFDSSNVFLSNDDEFLKVDEAFIFDFQQIDNQLIVSFNIKDGYYLYKEKFNFTSEKSDIFPVELPIGVDYNDEFFGLQEIYTQPLEFTVNIKSVDEGGSLIIRYQGCAKKGLCYPPVKKVIPLDKIKNNTSQSVLSAITGNSVNTQTITNTTSNGNTEKQNNIEQSEQFELFSLLENASLWLVIPSFFALGLALSFTPCVFPMYPILTSIIVGQGDKLSNKRAFNLSFFYVQGMAITYTLLGIVVALAGAQFQAMFQHPSVLIVLSIVFILLALSMFGAFNLALPSSWQNKLTQLSNKQEGGSYLGVVSMGAISGLVASPCTTAPLTGALIYISQTGDIAIGASALYALSLGMGLPLLILGSSGGKLLPKAGNWMNVIKNVFGILLLAVPIFLLERFVPAAASQILWGVLIMAAGTYFYVVNAETTKNLAYGIRTFVIFIILILGGIQLHQVIFNNHAVENIVEHKNTFIKVKNLAEMHAEINKANQANKTVMVDLYADWCSACKEFEEYTFPAKQVQEALSNTVLIQIDLTNTGSDSSKALMDKYEVFGLPSIMFFNKSANEFNNKRVTGFMNADDFSTHLRSFL